MTVPWYDSGGVQIHVGHVLDVLAGFEAESVQCVVTSPPYWGLRAYGTEPVIWGGSPDCDHMLQDAPSGREPQTAGGASPKSTLNHGAGIRHGQKNALQAAWLDAPAGKVLTGGTGPTSGKQRSNAGSQYGNAWVADPSRPQWIPQPDHSGETKLGTRGEQSTRAMYADPRLSGATCTRCGAWKGELGSEPIPDCLAWARGVAPCSVCFVCHLVTVFRAVRRVLHPTGTCWVNLGDSYAADHAQRRLTMPEGQVNWGLQSKTVGSRARDERGTPPGMKPKNLMMLPARVALALQADGWVLRSDIIWSKPNPMPESVTDRPTKAHEYLFLLAKSPRYYFDSDAIREPHARLWDGNSANGHTGRDGWGEGVVLGRESAPHCGMATTAPNPAGRNRRSVWTIPTESYEGAHFATFPRKLVEPCVLAGTSARGQCPRCGAPWRREVSERPMPRELANATKAHGGLGNNLGGQRHQDWLDTHPRETLGWQPTCACPPAEPVPQVTSDPCPSCGAPAERMPAQAPQWKRYPGRGDLTTLDKIPSGHTPGWRAREPEQTITTGWRPTCHCAAPEPVPQTVLDPFAGSGTTLYVARHHGRRAVGIELSPDYAKLCVDRLKQGVLDFGGML